MIHPTAILSPEAQIGQNVEIGPYCVIEAGVELGDGCWLQNHVTLCGPSKIGPGNKFHAYAVIGGRSQDLKYVGEPTFLEIGANNIFREFCTVNRGTAPGSLTRVGSHGAFLAYSHIAHDCIVGDHCIFSNNGTLAGHVEVEDYVILGGFSAVHQFCRLGQHAITGGCTKIIKDVAPYVVVDGNPARSRGLNLTGLERRGFSTEDVRALKEAYKCIHLRNLNLENALNELTSTDNACVAHLVEFYKKTQRGVC